MPPDAPGEKNLRQATGPLKETEKCTGIFPGVKRSFGTCAFQLRKPVAAGEISFAPLLRLGAAYFRTSFC